MMVGHLSLPIMMPPHCRAIRYVMVLTALILSVNADGDPDCEEEINLPRYTTHQVSPGVQLSLECPVKFCNNTKWTVSWYKLNKTHFVPVNSSHINIKLELSSDLQGKSSLTFKNIAINDSGVYQCRTTQAISHRITVVVNGTDEFTFVTPDTKINSSSDLQPLNNPWLYIYTAVGIVAFVIVVLLITVAAMLGCKGKSKSDTENQLYTTIPLVEHPSPPGLQASAGGSPSVPPPQRTSSRKTPPSQVNNLPIPGGKEHLYGVSRKDRKEQMTHMEEEKNSIVYASLDHQCRGAVAARPSRLQEECSEYAAIRVGVK